MKKYRDRGISAVGAMRRALYALLFSALCSLPAAPVSLAISDRVAAFVDEQAITVSELDEQYRNTVKISPDVTVREVLETMINKILILREAKKYRIEAPTVDQVIHEYIDLKIRAYIRISESDVERFYDDNRSQFPGKEFEDVREEIERYLTEKELNARLKEILKDLRKEAYIRVLYEK